MSRYFVEFCRKKLKRVSNDEEELKLDQEFGNQYMTTCFGLYQACLVGDVEAVRWYINIRRTDVNQPDSNGCTALFYCIQKDRVVLVRDLINAGANVNQQAILEEGIKITPCHVAAKYDRKECLKILLDNGADANVKNLFGQTPLHMAARRKLNDVIDILINHGKVSVNCTDNDMVTPLHLSATPGNDNERSKIVQTLLNNGACSLSEDNDGNTVFHEAARNNVDDVLDILIENKGIHFQQNESGFTSIAQVLDKPGKDGNNCLHLAVIHNSDKIIQKCLDYKADINKKTSDGDTPLHIACCKGNASTTKILLENGADLGIVDKTNRHCIHRAAAKGSVEVCDLLLKKGAFIDTNHPCGTALITASRFQQHEAVKFLLDQGASPSMRNTMLDTCLHIAVKNADVATVKIIMEKCGRELLELKDKNENTALHLAATTGNLEVFDILLAYNPNTKAINDRGKVAIHIAAENGRYECLKLFLESCKCSTNVTDFMWRTALHLACLSRSDLKIVELLLEHGADPNARDDRRWTPLLYVATKGCPYVTQLLVKYGADINLCDKNKMTALCLAAKNNCAEAVEVLLQHGANPTILNCDNLSCMDIALDNRHHDVCMVLAKSDKWKSLVTCSIMEKCLEYSPEVAKVILDKCIEYSGREIDADYKVTYNFDLLDPPTDEDEDYYGPMTMKIARRNELLMHPLTRKLLDTNWINGVRYIYYSQMLLLAVALVITTVFLVWFTRVLGECYDKLSEDEGYSKNHSCYQNKSCLSRNHQFYQDNETSCVKVNHSPGKTLAKRSIMFVYFLLYLGKELNQLRLERWEYFLEITNYLDVTVAVLFLLFVKIPSEMPIPYVRLKFGIMGIFAYYLLMFLWTRGYVERY
ncbi:ankyrin-3-like [Xenia sp. Carnegie-2017]|uniref:ankyrin-3-like n=1 Tax=Xenia sp. Carnegie-2017 TaxID=2897299 RepID=UPI001F04CECC|nr:ankyrin-3-like [Xenia sp. Carnegie-2017]